MATKKAVTKILPQEERNTITELIKVKGALENSIENFLATRRRAEKLGLFLDIVITGKNECFKMFYGEKKEVKK